MQDDCCVLKILVGKEKNKKRKAKMKKKLIIVIAIILCISMALLFFLSGDKEIHLYRSNISTITVRSQMEVPIKIADMSEDQIDDFVEYINSLRLIDTGLKNRKKGWQYYLYISQNQGDAIHITFLEGSIVDVDGHICIPLKASLLKEIYELLSS